jgi:hypothetical protein
LRKPRAQVVCDACWPVVCTVSSVEVGAGLVPVAVGLLVGFEVGFAVAVLVGVPVAVAIGGALDSSVSDPRPSVDALMGRSALIAANRIDAWATFGTTLPG